MGDVDTSIRRRITHSLSFESMEAKQSQQSMEECKVPRKTWLEQKLGLNRFYIAMLTAHCSIRSMTSKCERNKLYHCRQFGETEELDTIENVPYNCSCFQNHFNKSVRCLRIYKRADLFVWATLLSNKN